jgi:hypothetical protein
MCNERRVRGHIFVCVLAYLFEQELQVLYGRSLGAEIPQGRNSTDAAGSVTQLHELENTYYTDAKIVQEFGRRGVLQATFLV